MLKNDFSTEFNISPSLFGPALYFAESPNISTTFGKYICKFNISLAKPTLGLSELPTHAKAMNGFYGTFYKKIFWDVLFENIDYDKKADFVIERVFERGDVEDIRNCRRYYGDEKITLTLLKAKFLPETRLYLASAVIGRPLDDFRCYSLRKQNLHLPY